VVSLTGEKASFESVAYNPTFSASPPAHPAHRLPPPPTCEYARFTCKTTCWSLETTPNTTDSFL
jgi:hypothetical protein